MALPHHSFSSPVSPSPLASVLPTDSLSPKISTDTLKSQLSERQKQLEASPNGIGRNVLVRQINQLQDKIRDETEDTKKADELPPMTREKLKNLERDLTAYRAFPSTSQTLRKDKRTGLDPIPSPSTSLSPHDIILPPPPTGSTPTKRRSKIPNKDRRNTDIEFATEIGQGLLLEVRKMQSLLQEKEEQLRALEIQKADLERSADLTTKQLRVREESEEKLKEDIWNLELARQEITLTVTDLQQHLNRATTDHQRALQQVSVLQTELDQVRDREERQNVTIDGMKTRHEQDIASVRRHAANLAKDNNDQQKQIENLTREMKILRAQATIASKPNSQNYSAQDDDEMNNSLSGPRLSVLECPPTPEPSSPQPMVRRQSIEVETLKSTLGHTHRMISNLRSNLHREKTEKFELKKLLAESQETIEQLQNDPRLWVDSQVRTHDRKRKSSVPASATRRRHARRVRGGTGGGGGGGVGGVGSTGRSFKEGDEGLEIDTEHPLGRFSEESESDFDPESLPTPDQSSSPLAMSMADELNRASHRNSSELHPTISVGVQTDLIPEPPVPAPMPATIAPVPVPVPVTVNVPGSAESVNVNEHVPIPVVAAAKTESAGVQTDTTEPIAVPSASISTQTLEMVIPTESISTQTLEAAVIPTESISTQTLEEAVIPTESISTQTLEAAVAPTESTSTQTLEPVAVPTESISTQTLEPVAVPTESISTQTPKIVISGETISTQTHNTSIYGESISTQTEPEVVSVSLANVAPTVNYIDNSTANATDNEKAKDKAKDNAAAAAAAAAAATAAMTVGGLGLGRQYGLSHADSVHPTDTSSISPFGADRSQETSVPEIRAISPDDLGFSPDQFSLSGLDSVGSFGTVTIAPPRPTCSPPASLLIKAHGVLSSVSDDIHPAEPIDGRRQSISASSVSTAGSELHGSSNSNSAIGIGGGLDTEASSPVTQPTDPMITLITQTMIGDWLWKYTRKTVGGGLSEHRHKRYFWIHPYTRTLYWSIHAPGGDDESRTRSASIEQVDVISDPTISPPGLPNVSILIQTSTRQIKLTAPSMAVHTVWVESLRHLLKRADSERTNASQQQHQQQHETEHYHHPKHSAEELESDLEDGLEDVRMCCDGKHHVSKLEKEKKKEREKRK